MDCQPNRHVSIVRKPREAFSKGKVSSSLPVRPMLKERAMKLGSGSSWRISFVSIAATVGVLLSCAAASAADGSLFRSKTELYALTISPGWSLDDSDFTQNAGADAAFAPGGDRSQGSVFVTISRANGSLEYEVADYAQGRSMSGKRWVKIDGSDCITFAQLEGSVYHNSIACQVTVPLNGGPQKVAFIMTSSATPSHYDQQTPVFWQMANSIRWGPGISP